MIAPRLVVVLLTGLLAAGGCGSPGAGVPAPARIGGAPDLPLPEGALARVGTPVWGHPWIAPEPRAPSATRLGSMAAVGGPRTKPTPRPSAERDPFARPEPVTVVPIEGGRWAFAVPVRPGYAEVRWEVWDPVGGRLAVGAPRSDQARPTPDGAWLVGGFYNAAVSLVGGAGGSRRALLGVGSREVLWSASTAVVLTRPDVRRGEPLDDCEVSAVAADHTVAACYRGPDDGEVRLLAMPSGRELATAPWTGPDAPQALAVASEGRRVSMMSGHGDLVAWTPTTGESWTRAAFLPDDLWELAWTDDGSLLVGAHPRLGTLVLDGETGERLDLPTHHAAPITSVAAHPDGRVVTCDSDQAVHVWAADGAHLHRLVGGRVPSGAVCSWDGDDVLALNHDGTRGLRWRLARGERVIESVGVRPATGSSAARVASAPSGDATPGVALPRDAALPVVDPHGRVWAVRNDRIEAWVGGRHEPVVTWEAGAVSALTVAGDRILAGHLDGTTTIWPLPPYEAPVAAPPPPPWAPGPIPVDVVEVAFDPGGGRGAHASHITISDDGTRLAAVTARGPTLVLWDTASGDELARLAGLGPVASLAFEADGVLRYRDRSGGLVRVGRDGAILRDASRPWAAAHGIRVDEEGPAILEGGRWVRAGEGSGATWRDAAIARSEIRSHWIGPGLNASAPPPGADIELPIVPARTRSVLGIPGGDAVLAILDYGVRVVRGEERHRLELPRPDWLPAHARGRDWAPDLGGASWTWLDPDHLLAAGPGWVASWTVGARSPRWVRPSWGETTGLAADASGSVLARLVRVRGKSGFDPVRDVLVVTELDSDAPRCVVPVSGDRVVVEPSGEVAWIMAGGVLTSVRLDDCVVEGPSAPEEPVRAVVPDVTVADLVGAELAAARWTRPDARLTLHGDPAGAVRVGIDPAAGLLVVWRPEDGEVLGHAIVEVGARVSVAGPGHAVVDDDGEWSIWSLQPLAVVDRLPIDGRPPLGNLVVGADGVLAALPSGARGEGVVWVRPVGGPGRYVSVGSLRPSRLRFSPDGRHLVVGGNGRILVRSVASLLAAAAEEAPAGVSRWNGRGEAARGAHGDPLRHMPGVRGR